MSSIIEISGLWKEYRLGVIGHGTLTHDLQAWWAKIRGREDPNSIVRSDFSPHYGRIKGDQFWALQDINVGIKTGEVLGIIGKNGAGKSTLLKILSRVTAPSKGLVTAKGRIASLLEVGTGFHPELTGRENIFLNGAILGMSRDEIKVKLEEIIDFSGVEAFIDTPVKRYSSGMYVRLAFAVAAHLEPEILVIDEVLAVGDAEFQKKCLGKMESISRAGRTILFVSHNLTAVKSLCSKGLVLSEGKVLFEGNTDEAVEQYIGSDFTGETCWRWDEPGDPSSNPMISIQSVELKPLKGSIIDIDSGFSFECTFLNRYRDINLDFTVYLSTSENVQVFETGLILHTNKDSKEANYTITGIIPPNLLNSGQYRFSLLFGRDQRYELLRLEDLVCFCIENTATNRGTNMGRAPGVIRPILDWSFTLDQ